MWCILIRGELTSFGMDAVCTIGFWKYIWYEESSEQNSTKKSIDWKWYWNDNLMPTHCRPSVIACSWCKTRHTSWYTVGQKLPKKSRPPGRPWGPPVKWTEPGWAGDMLKRRRTFPFKIEIEGVVILIFHFNCSRLYFHGLSSNEWESGTKLVLWKSR